MADCFADLNIALWSVFFLIPVGRATEMDRLDAGQCEEAFERLWSQSKCQPYMVKTTEAPHYRRYVLQNKPKGGNGQRPAFIPAGVNDGKGVMFVSHTGVIHPTGFLPVTCGVFPSAKHRRCLPEITGLSRPARCQTIGRQVWVVRVQERVWGQPRTRLRCHGQPVCGRTRLRLFPIGSHRHRIDPLKDLAMKRRVTVIGGGVSGLAAANHLLRIAPEVEVRVLEASSRIGGVIQTTQQDGFLIEGAADNFITTTSTAIDLCKDLGLGDDLIGTNPKGRGAMVVSRGRTGKNPRGVHGDGPLKDLAVAVDEDP